MEHPPPTKALVVSQGNCMGKLTIPLAISNKSKLPCWKYTLPETNMAHENPPIWWYLPGKMWIFMGYVSFREGIIIHSEMNCTKCDDEWQKAMDLPIRNGVQWRVPRMSKKDTERCGTVKLSDDRLQMHFFPNPRCAECMEYWPTFYLYIYHKFKPNVGKDTVYRIPIMNPMGMSTQYILVLREFFGLSGEQGRWTVQFEQKVYKDFWASFKEWLQIWRCFMAMMEKHGTIPNFLVQMDRHSSHVRDHNNLSKFLENSQYLVQSWGCLDISRDVDIHLITWKLVKAFGGKPRRIGREGERKWRTAKEAQRGA